MVKKTKIISQKNETGGEPLSPRPHTLAQQHPKNWQIKENCLDACGLVQQTHVKLSVQAHLQITAMLDVMNSDEFLAYLVGGYNNNVFTVEEIYIPNQEVTSANVEALEQPPTQCIGVLHSHHNMGAFFSHTDMQHVNINHDLSIVVAKTPQGVEYKATARLEVPCGHKVRIENVSIIIDYGHYASWAKQQKEAKVKHKSVLSPSLALMRAECPTCLGSGRLFGDILCPTCHGLGWD